MRWIAEDRRHGLALGAVLVLALALRLYGINWDEGLLFHPDERQVLVVAMRLELPERLDLSLLLSPDSPLNPAFFAYGSLPLYLLRLASAAVGALWLDGGSLLGVHLVGRGLSALFDSGTVALTYLLGRRLYDRRAGLWGAALTALAVLHIQLAHFYTVDTLLTFLVVLTLLLGVRVAERATLGRGLAAGAAVGLALATKVSAAPLALPLGLAWIAGSVEVAGEEDVERLRLVRRAMLGLLASLLTALVVMLLAQPYAALDAVRFVRDVLQESWMARGAADIPYTRQYIGTAPYLYPLQQLVVWSLGPPLGLAALAGWLAATAHAAREAWRRRWVRAGVLWVPLAWALIYFAITGGFQAKFLRYMLPLTPLLCLWAGWMLSCLWAGSRERGRAVQAMAVAAVALVTGGTALYALAYTRVYRQEHPWIQATRWICAEIPAGSRLVHEHWDDPLPLRQVKWSLGCRGLYQAERFPAYDPDDQAKLQTLLKLLSEGDHVVISSQRLYGSVPRLPERYPLTTRYYRALMAGELGYTLVYYASAYPGLFGVAWRDDPFAGLPFGPPPLLAEAWRQQPALVPGRADESYSVYDHPLPLVFANTGRLSREALLEVLGDAAADLPPAAAE